jgi:hypothetical protein
VKVRLNLSLCISLERCVDQSLGVILGLEVSGCLNLDLGLGTDLPSKLSFGLVPGVAVNMALGLGLRLGLEKGIGLGRGIDLGHIHIKGLDNAKNILSRRIYKCSRDFD